MKTFALLIDVPNTGWSDLVATASGLATGMVKSYLCTPARGPDVSIRMLSQATRSDVEGALAEVQRQARPNDLLILMFAGHGISASPGDATADRKFAGWALAGRDKFDAADFQRWYESLPVRWVVVSDCCFGEAIRHIEPTALHRDWTQLVDTGAATPRLARQLLLDSTDRSLQLSELVSDAADTLRDRVPAGKQMVFIGAAAQAGIVSNEGEWLLAMLLAGGAALRLKYSELRQACSLVRADSQAFVVDCRGFENNYILD